MDFSALVVEVDRMASASCTKQLAIVPQFPIVHVAGRRRGKSDQEF